MKRPVQLCYAMLCLFIVSCQIDTETQEFEEMVDEQVNGPALPVSHFNYANPNLPAHFTEPGAGTVASLDNTPVDNPVTDAGATLGRVLFYDQNLSLNRSTSCGSCHAQAVGFSDPRTLSVGFEGGLTGRHSMSLSNARYYRNGRFFWDERAATLEDQVLGPIQDPVEMGLTLSQLVDRVEAQPYYNELFTDAFGSQTVNSERISKALAQFVRSMVSYQSRYDAGRAQVNSAADDFPNFNAQENRGKALFVLSRAEGGLGCGSCHGSDVQVPNEALNIGLDQNTAQDRGAFTTYNDPAFEGSFKVPSLRNVAVTAPYMHDGRFDNLREVIAHYRNGVQPHPNLDARLTANGVTGGQPIRMNINRDDERALMAFFNTLTDEEFLNDEKYSNPFEGDGMQ